MPRRGPRGLSPCPRPPPLPAAAPQPPPAHSPHAATRPRRPPPAPPSPSSPERSPPGSLASPCGASPAPQTQPRIPPSPISGSAASRARRPPNLPPQPLRPGPPQPPSPPPCPVPYRSTLWGHRSSPRPWRRRCPAPGGARRRGCFSGAPSLRRARRACTQRAGEEEEGRPCASLRSTGCVRGCERGRREGASPAPAEPAPPALHAAPGRRRGQEGHFPGGMDGPQAAVRRGAAGSRRPPHRLPRSRLRAARLPRPAQAGGGGCPRPGRAPARPGPRTAREPPGAARSPAATEHPATES